MSRLVVSGIPNLNAIIIKQIGGKRVFISTTDSIIISIPNLALLLKYLIINKVISEKILEGILSEIKEK